MPDLTLLYVTLRCHTSQLRSHAVLAMLDSSESHHEIISLYQIVHSKEIQSSYKSVSVTVPVVKSEQISWKVATKKMNVNMGEFLKAKSCRNIL